MRPDELDETEEAADLTEAGDDARWLVLALVVALTMLLAVGSAFVGISSAIAHAGGCGGG